VEFPSPATTTRKPVFRKDVEVKLLSTLSKPIDGFGALTAILVMVGVVALAMIGLGDTEIIGNIVITELIVVGGIIAVNNRRSKAFLSRACKIASKAIGLTALVLVAVGLLWGGMALYAAMSLKLIVVVGIIAIVIAVLNRN
jgi:hypothetical protein